MTTVPAIEHGLNKTVVACGAEAAKCGFTLISSMRGFILNSRP